MEGGGSQAQRDKLKAHHQPLYSFKVEARAYFNRFHSLLYICAISGLLYHRSLHLLNSTTFVSLTIFLFMLLSDLVLAFMWVTLISFRWRPSRRHAYPENLSGLIDDKDFPSQDVFICTADPYKEPPINVVNTALSVMAYDYPTDKISVYVSDDGGSELTLFAFMEAARFARHWLPFCRENGIQQRCPEAYFKSGEKSLRAHNLKVMYQSMRDKIERVMEIGKVTDDQITSEEELEPFKKYWTNGFTRQNHPSIIQVLLESSKDVDVTGHALPNLIYVSREKSTASPHHFKAGALNVLVRVSGSMSNAPVVLTLDCDMYSNDPQAPRRALCYLLDPLKSSRLAFVQFPQRFQGINKNDIYACELKRMFLINPVGMDGLKGPDYAGTGCFFNRAAFYSSPSSSSSSSSSSLVKPDYKSNSSMNGSIGSDSVLKAAHEVAGCSYENGTSWGSKMGFRYGSLVEDFYTGYRLHCEGWKSVFCNPENPSFLGDVPINLEDALGQIRRWCVGLLEVTFSKYSPISYGTTRISLLMGLAYAHYAFWPAWSIPITTYGLLPQLALLNQFPLFPKLSDPWFYLYAYLFIAAYAQDLFEFLVAGGSVQRWWSDQRMWMIRGVTSYLFGLIQFTLEQFGFSAVGFNVTSKVINDEQGKRYREGVFEFGVSSPMFVTLAMVATINLVSFMVGLARALAHGSIQDMFVQLFISGFVLVNCLPIYEAMVLRRDKGSLPMKTTLTSVLLAGLVYLLAYFTFKV